MPLSEDTLVRCLLTFGSIDEQKPLNRRERTELGGFLDQHRLSLGQLREAVLTTVEMPFASRLRDLLSLSRSERLKPFVDTYERGGIHLVGPQDAGYPRRLRHHLGFWTPCLFCHGSLELLDRGGLAIVGSREISDESKAYAKHIGQMAANAGHLVISGGALGADETGMAGALEAFGQVIGVLPTLDALVRPKEALLARKEGRFLAVSTHGPNSPFQTWKLFERNTYIYGLADAAIVTDSRLTGGTWGSATQGLKKIPIPFFVRHQGQPSEGLEALKEKGASPWPFATTTELADFLAERSRPYATANQEERPPLGLVAESTSSFEET